MKSYVKVEKYNFQKYLKKQKNLLYIIVKF